MLYTRANFVNFKYRLHLYPRTHIQTQTQKRTMVIIRMVKKGKNVLQIEVLCAHKVKFNPERKLKAKSDHVSLSFVHWMSEINHVNFMEKKIIFEQ